MAETTFPWSSRTATVLIAFNRPQHTAKVLEALRRDRIQNLFVLCDAPRKPEDEAVVRETRALIHIINWTKPTVVLQDQNQGLARSVLLGVHLALKKFDAVVLLEDDCVPHTHYYEWIYSCLEKYKDVPEVFGISGYSIPFARETLDQYPYDAYFFPRMDSWGWATWKDRWQKDNRNLARLTLQCLEKGIDLEQGGKDVPNAIGDVLLGRVKDTWTLPWLVNVYLHGGCYVYPTVSHINNIGMDGTGIHCGYTNKYDTILNENSSTRLPDKPFFETAFCDLFLAYQNAPHRLYRDEDLKDIANKHPLKVANISTRINGSAGRAVVAQHQALLSAGYDSYILVGEMETQSEGIYFFHQAGCQDIFDHPMVREADIVSLHEVDGLVDCRQLNSIPYGKKIVWSLHELPDKNIQGYASEIASQILCACPCGAFATTLQADPRWSTHPISIQPPCVNTAIFSPYQKSTIREELGLFTEIPVIFFHHSPDCPAQTSTLLIQALRLLGNQQPAPQICYYGTQIPTLPESDAFLYLGDVREESILAALYSMADAVVLTHPESVFPQIGLESLSCGTPIVAFQEGCNGEIIQHEATGFLVREKSAEALAKGIAWLLSHGGAQIQSSCRTYAETHFSSHNQARAYGTFYQQLMDNPAMTATMDKKDNNLLKIPTEPVSRLFGFDRGKPVDRHFIENFLASHSHAIHGDVLEIGESTYTEQFAQGAFTPWMFHAQPIPGAKFFGDLSGQHNLPENSFDAIICTQTLNFILEPFPALQALYNAIKPGGTLLITVAGLSQISRYDMDRWGDYWRFTDLSLRKFCEKAAPGAIIDVAPFGNVGAAKAFLDGLACEELDPTIFTRQDPDYQIIVSAHIVKPKQLQASNPTIHTNSKNNGSFIPPSILLYHRVATDRIDSQLLATSPENFRQHLEHLASTRPCFPLDEWVDGFKRKSLPSGAITITFDDGYVDNLTNASPLLSSMGLHATLFVTTGIIGSGQEFWWDALEYIFLTDYKLPDSLHINIEGHKYNWDVSSAPGRLQCMDQLTAYLKRVPPFQIERMLDMLFQWSGISRNARSSHRTMDELQLRQIVQEGAFSIGSHAVSHASLAHMDTQTQLAELRDSKATLESILQKDVPFLSYPFGSPADFNASTLQAAQSCGYHAALANVQGDASHEDSLFALPRRLVRNWNGAQFAQWLAATDKDTWEQQAVSGRTHKLLYGA